MAGSPAQIYNLPAFSDAAALAGGILNGSLDAGDSQVLEAYLAAQGLDDFANAMALVRGRSIVEPNGEASRLLIALSERDARAINLALQSLKGWKAPSLYRNSEDMRRMVFDAIAGGAKSGTSAQQEVRAGVSNRPPAAVRKVAVSASGVKEELQGGARQLDPQMRERFLEIVRQKGARKDFRGIDFTRLPTDAVQEADRINPSLFLDANLEGANLEGLDLSGVRFIVSQLKGARFAGANLKNAFFRGVDLSGQDFSGCDLNSAYFHMVKLTGHSLEGAVLDNVTFDSADLSGMDFSGRDLSGVSFQGTMKLRGVLLRGTGFYGARLRGADFSHLDMANAIFGIRPLMEGANIPSKLERVNFRGTNLKGAVFGMAEIIDQDFSETDLTDAKFKGVKLKNVRFGPRLRGVHLGLRNGSEQVELSDKDLTRAELEWSAARNAILVEATIPSETPLENVSGSILWYTKPHQGGEFVHIPASRTTPEKYQDIRPDLSRFLSSDGISQLDKIAGTRYMADQANLEKFLYLATLWGMNKTTMRRYLERTLGYTAERPKQTVPWLLAMWKIVRYPLHIVEAFAEDELAAFERLPKGEVKPGGERPEYYFAPEKIERRWRGFLVRSITQNMRAKKDETDRLTAHVEANPGAWHEGDFIKDLALMASFMDYEGQYALKGLVNDLAFQPARGADFNVSPKYERLKGVFDSDFVEKWARDAVLAVSNGNGAGNLSAAEIAKAARTEFYQAIAAQLERHTEGGEPTDEKVTRMIGLLKQGEDTEAIRRLSEELISASSGEVLNDLKELRRGLDRDFSKAGGKGETVFISGRPQDIIRAGLIGTKSCTRPIEPAPGNKSGQPLTRASEGQFKIAIYRVGRDEVARSHLEVTKDESGNPHLLAEVLYAESDFHQKERFAGALKEYAKTTLGILPEHVHIQFTDHNMSSWPSPLKTKTKVYRDTFK